MTVVIELLLGACFCDGTPKFEPIDCDIIAEFFDATVHRDRSRYAFDFVTVYQECGSRSLDFAAEALQRKHLSEVEKSEVMMIVLVSQPLDAPLPRTLEPLVRALLRDPAAKVRSGAADVLEKVGCSDCGAEASAALDIPPYANDYSHFVALAIRDHGHDCRANLEVLRAYVPEAVWTTSPTTWSGLPAEAYKRRITATVGSGTDVP